MATNFGYELSGITAVLIEGYNGWMAVKPGTLEKPTDDVFAFVDNEGDRVYAYVDRLIAVATNGN
ncbi:hypothetical protein GCM10010466_29690 [Planomonospora alba]|uniref:Uncharacterized protein n=1 Tax=Planomonospora alba TaxID=161354 RepID=A0ABP6N7S0_9ACTN